MASGSLVASARSSMCQMIVSVPRETFPGERRVALTPLGAGALTATGLEVVVEPGAGEGAGFGDGAYLEKGARMAKDRQEALGGDVVAQVRTFGANQEAGGRDLELFRPGQTVIGFADPLGAPDATRQMAERGVVLVALELMPRISRAQSMDALSSQATVAGYKSAVLVAQRLNKLLPMLTTAAGTIAPARVFVVGAGVAGLQAIATVRRLGAVVQAYDVRPAVQEQVESVGAKFVSLPIQSGDAEQQGGYAGEMGEDFYQRQRELMAQVVQVSDAVITTALVPGARAPVLVDASMVMGMRRGSVICDLAAGQGGNCELSRPDEDVVTEGGVTILGPTNLAATVPHDASQMYSRNLSNLVLHLTSEGSLDLDPQDVIVSGTVVSRDGEVVHPAVRQALGL